MPVLVALMAAPVSGSGRVVITVEDTPRSREVTEVMEEDGEEVFALEGETSSPRSAPADPGALEEGLAVIPRRITTEPPLSRPPLEIVLAPTTLLQDLHRHGVVVYGEGLEEHSVRIVYQAVAQFKPNEIGRLYVNCTGRGMRAGVLGRYTANTAGFGMIALFNDDIAHVALHEVSHHMLILQRPDMAWSLKHRLISGGYVKVRNIPSRYAMASEAELLAEFVTRVREITGDLPAYAPFTSTSFNPEALPVLATRHLYNPGQAVNLWR